MAQPTDAIPLHEFDEVTVRVQVLRLDPEWRAWLHAHAQNAGGLVLALRRMVLFQGVVALLRQSHETEQQLRVYLTEADYQNADLRRILACWRRGEPVPELAPVAPPATVTPPPPSAPAAAERRLKRS